MIDLDLKNRTDAFVGDIERDSITVYTPLCYDCANRIDARCCKAYPEGIPVKIIVGDVDHNKPYLGDHLITYVKKV